jgi:hypothetical protein
MYQLMWCKEKLSPEEQVSHRLLVCRSTSGEVWLDVACQTPGGECAQPSKDGGPRCVVRRTMWEQLGQPPALTRMMQSWSLEWHFQFGTTGDVGVCLIVPQDFNLVRVHELEALAGEPH